VEVHAAPSFSHAEQQLRPAAPTAPIVITGDPRFPVLYPGPSGSVLPYPLPGQGEICRCKLGFAPVRRV